MQLLTITLCQFIFLFLILVTGISGIRKNDLIGNKFFLFIVFFIFQLIANLVSNFEKKCKMTMSNIFSDSLFVGLLSVIGYSIYIDLVTMNTTFPIIYPYIYTNNINSLFLTTIVVSFIFIIKLLQVLFTGNEECANNENYNYELNY